MASIPTGEGTIRPLTADDLPMVLTWRNDSTVRSVMFHSGIISLAEHRAWFDKVSHNALHRLLIVESPDGPAGFVQFGDVLPGGISDWGFYARPSAPRGTGRLLGVTALDHAFGTLQLHKVCGRAIAFNEASIRMHKRLGFKQEGLLEEHHLANDAYHSVVFFGLLGRDWQMARASLLADRAPNIQGGE